jgi:multiple sugar transport system permease protein
MRTHLKWGRLLRGIMLLALFFITMFPFLWMVTSSFKAEQDILTYPPAVFAASYTMAQYQKVFTAIPLWQYVKNTVIFSFAVTTFSLFLDSMAGYAYARIRFKGRKLLFNLVLMTMMIPFQVTMIPLFIEIFKLGLLNTYFGLVLPRITSAFGIFMMRSFFVGLPKDLEEAARVDGLHEFGIYFRVMLPLCKPAMMALGVFLLMGNWNDLLYPLMLTTTTQMRTLPSGLAMFVGERVTQYGPSIAGTVISILPLLLFYFVAQRYFVAGIAMTGIKE